MIDFKHTPEDLKTLQSYTLERKITITQVRVTEWYMRHDNNVYVSFSGGKDSTVLADIVAKICQQNDWKLRLVYCDTGLEYPEIKNFVRMFKGWLRETYQIEVELNIVKPTKRFYEVVKEYGYPIISKYISGLIHRARKPNPPRSVVHAMNNGYDKQCFNIGKWVYLMEAPFQISDTCCSYLKKNPLNYGYRYGYPITGVMAVEGQQRRQSWLKNGCNNFDSKKPISNPLGFWKEQDILQYIRRCKVPIASIYGDIVEEWTSYKRKENKPTGKLVLTGEQRTGCMFCAFGVHLEKEPNRFQRMKITHPKQHEYCMKPLEEGGLGMAEVLDYIGVKYE